MSLLLNAVGTRVTDLMSNRAEVQAQPLTQLERITADAARPADQLETISMQDMLSQQSNADHLASNVSRAIGEAARQIAGRIASLEGGATQPGQEVALNPQPLPPRWAADAIARPGSEVMLNPQPLPPRWVAEAIKRPGEEVMLNPQPLPPRWVADALRRAGDEVALNPQPLPPRWNTRMFDRLFQEVALNPQPLPPIESGRLTEAHRQLASGVSRIPTDPCIDASPLQKQLGKLVG